MVTKVERLNIPSSLKIETETVKQINVTKYGDASGKQVTWSKDGNVTFVTDETGTTEVTGNPTGDTVYVKAGVKSNGASGTVTVSATREESKSCNITISKEIKVGDEVNYSTALNGVNLDTWKIFYKNGDYTYLILSGYLPNSAVSDDIRTNFSLTHGNGNYTIKATNNRGSLVNAMNTKSNWNSLLTGTMGTQQIDYRNTEDTNIFAMGSPTLDLFIDSWNSEYPSTNTEYNGQQLYKAVKTGMSGAIDWGYYVGKKENPTSTEVNLSGCAGYDNTVFYPYKNSQSNNTCDGYWLASPSADNANRVMRVMYNGSIYADEFNSIKYAFRPIVCLPTNIIE